MKPVHRCGGWAPRPVFLCSGAKAEVAVETTAATAITSTVAATAAVATTAAVVVVYASVVVINRQ